MENGGLLRDVALVMLTAGVTSLIARKLRLPLVAGYLLAGFLLGPSVPMIPFIQNPENINKLVEVGIAFLLFFIGLELRLQRLKDLGPRVLVAGLLECAIIFSIGYFLGRAMGWSPLGALHLGAMLTPCSTLVLIKALDENRARHRAFGRLAIGIAVVEDLFMILALVALGSIATAGSVSVGNLVQVGLNLALFTGVALIIGLVLGPRLFDRLFKAGHHEPLVVCALGLCFGLAQLSATLGYSAALGAFVAGLIAGETLAREWLIQRLESMREFFTALFFVSIGVLFDSKQFGGSLPLICGIGLLFVFSKCMAIAVGGTLAGNAWRTSLQTGLAMSHLGEFSLIMAAGAVAKGILPPEAQVMIISLCVGSALLSALLVKKSNPIADGVASVLPLSLKSILSFYESRLNQPRTLGTQSRAWRVIQGPLLFAVGEAVAVAVVLAGCGFLLGWLPTVSSRLPWIANYPLIVVWIVAAVTGLPFFVACVMSLQKLAKILAELAVPERADRASGGHIEIALQRALAALFVLILLLVLGPPARPLLPTGLAYAVVVIAAMGLMIVFWRQLLVMQKWMAGTLQSSLTLIPTMSKVAHEEARHLFEEKYPVNAGVRQLVVMPDSHVLGRTLRQLRVREETGATILSLTRSGFELVNPPADTPLFPEDHLLLVGEPHHLKEAASFFDRRGEQSPMDASRIWTLRITEYSPVIGKTLRGIDLRGTTGVAVVGLVRDGSRMTNPPPDTILATADELTLFGTLLQLGLAGGLLGAEVVEG